MKISIVVPVYNDLRVSRALDSILSQEHADQLDLVVVDAGSTDGTLDVVRRYEDDISVLVSEPDNGIFDGLNKGIASTSGGPDDVVHFVGADDHYADRFVFRDVMAAFGKMRNSMPATAIRSTPIGRAGSFVTGRPVRFTARGSTTAGYPRI